MNETTLEDLLRMEVPYTNRMREGHMSPDFRIAVQEKTEDAVRVIIHASGHNSDTLDLWIKGNVVTRI